MEAARGPSRRYDDYAGRYSRPSGGPGRSRSVHLATGIRIDIHVLLEDCVSVLLSMYLPVYLSVQ